jgi:hypothetical protein
MNICEATLISEHGSMLIRLYIKKIPFVDVIFVEEYDSCGD